MCFRAISLFIAELFIQGLKIGKNQEYSGLAAHEIKERAFDSLPFENL